MKEKPRQYRFARFLVRWRGFFFGLMTALAAVSVVLIPGTRINSDLTTNLPDDSPMYQGLQILEKHFPALDIRMQTLRVMFVSEPPSDSLQRSLEALLPDGRLTEVRQDGSRTLYQFMLPVDADGHGTASRIKQILGDRALVEIDDSTGMPDNVLLMIGTGVLVAFVILFLMCPSFVETLLFLLSLGIAVLINMGTNALLPSVRLVTHTLSAVLQLVLSMDYGIILMNRYRQEKKLSPEKEEAMTAAIAGSAPSILSSCLTTVAGLLMLVFIRLRIGADLGVVLSKGVLCSLVATFTVLPALILWFDRAVTATEKWTLRVPTGRLSRFEMRARIPLTLVFIALAVGSWFLQSRTRITYSLSWATPITEIFPPHNSLMMLYPTCDEAAIPALSDSIAALESGVQCISYPDIALRPRTAREMTAELETLSPEMAEKIPQGSLGLLYYAALHPDRNERMRFDELLPEADSLLALAGTLLPPEALESVSSRFDMKRLMRGFSLPEAPSPVVEMPVEEPEPQLIADAAAAGENPPAAEPAVAEPLSQEAVPDTSASSSGYFYEEIMRQRTSAEMAVLTGMDAGTIAMVYRIAGSGRKGRPETLNVREFLEVVETKVLANKLYATMVSPSQKALFYASRQEVERICEEAELLAEAEEMPPPDTLAAASPESWPDAPVAAVAEAAESPETTVAPEVAAATEAPAAPEPEEPSPLEVLMDMAFSGKRYTSAQCHRALAGAGMDVTRSELDLLFLYHGWRTAADTTARLSLSDLASFLEGLASEPLVARYADSSQVAALSGVKGMLDENLGMLRGEDWSVLLMASDLPDEGDRTFSFIENVEKEAVATLSASPYFIGYSQMNREIKDAFPGELLLLTLLTVAAIFVIIAVSFRSLLVPVLLIPTVLTAVWMSVFVSGMGGKGYLFLAYLIVQGILMGAAIDYSILFTHYYIDARRSLGKEKALAAAYGGAVNAIMTSGLILIVAPWVMTIVISDPMIISILRGISGGALAAFLIVLLLLPAVLVLCDKWIVRGDVVL